MLVKKFEAPSMKEALELIKNQLGPDAIILSARENGSNFGLVGKSSVEVTAAVSETQLKKKQVAESRMKEDEKGRLRQSSARVQREFIQKSVNRYLPNHDEAPVAKATPKAARYIEIADDEAASPNNAYNRVAAKVPASRSSFVETKSATTSPKVETDEVLSLKSEVHHLKFLLETLKKSPQSQVSLHPGASEGIPFEMSALYQRLIESGISEENTVAMCKEGLKHLSHDQLKKKALIDAWAAKKILQDTTLTLEPYSPGVHIFLGGAGQGKTSALVKLASHYVIREQKPVAIMTTDTKRVGAVEQLKIYSQILNVPFAVIKTKGDWVNTEQLLRNYYAILVDFPGVSLKNLDEVNELQRLLPPQEVRRHTHLVLSVNQKDIDAFEIARRYKLTHFEDVIFTKLDESAHHGIICNFQNEFKLPLHSFGVGPLIPEDYEVATKERVVDLIFKLSKLKGS